MNKKITIIIPTYNSALSLENALNSIKKQKYPKSLVEVLVIDGGSKDKTLRIAKKFNAKIFNNKKRQQEYAKSIGLRNAKGEIVVFLVSYEALEKNDSIEDSVNEITANRLLILLASGYKKPPSSSSVNDYINFFSDPFAHFMYQTSSGYDTKIESWMKKYPHYKKEKNSIVFSFFKNEQLPLVDMAGGTMINWKKIKQRLNKQVLEETFIAKLFYEVSVIDRRVGIMKDCIVLHDSVDGYAKLLNKIRWRVRVNVHYKSIPGTGFSNREVYQTFIFRLKKYLFLPYALTLALPLWESIYYAIKYKKVPLLLHLPLTVYTAFVIIYEYLLLSLGVKPKISTYGKS